MIKYRYALDQNDDLIDVQSLEKDTKDKTQRFFCLDTKEELIAKLGRIKVKHFALKSAINSVGSLETYLHALGKKAFYDRYKYALQNNIPFYLAYSVKQKCNRLKSQYGIICEFGCEQKKFDLTQYFIEIKYEKKFEEFIPDLLLSNPSTGEQIFIEIAVTHFCSEEKIKSGNRIIQFEMQSEIDIEMINQFSSGVENKNVRFYNFKEKVIEQSFCKPGGCSQSFEFFCIAKNGKSYLNFISESSTLFTLKNAGERYTWYKLTVCKNDQLKDYDELLNAGYKFRHYLALAYKANIKVKNCFLCRYHATNQSWDYTEGEPIFCKYKKISCGSNYAVECDAFRVEEKYIEAYI